MRLRYGFILAAASLIVASHAGAQAQASVYGRVLFTTTGGSMVPQSDAVIKLLLLDNGRIVYQTFSDSRGYFALYKVQPGVYKVQIFLNGKVGVGSIIKVVGRTTTIPQLSINWSDPCGRYYGNGYDVDYIRTKLNVPWRGDSGDWLRLAQQYHWPAERVPKVGAIAVLRVGRGHLGWVESINPDRQTFVVSQWNEPGQFRPDGASCSVTTHFGVRTETTWRTDDARIMGFIYPP